MQAVGLALALVALGVGLAALLLLGRLHLELRRLGILDLRRTSSDTRRTRDGSPPT